MSTFNAPSALATRRRRLAVALVCAMPTSACGPAPQDKDDVWASPDDGDSESSGENTGEGADGPDGPDASEGAESESSSPAESGAHTTSDAPASESESESESGSTSEAESETESETETSGVGSEAGSPCLDESYLWEPVRPQLVFVLDASGSMSTQMPGLSDAWSSRWGVLHEVVRGVLQRHEAHLEFGMKLFPTQSDAPDPSELCTVSPGLEHGLAANAGLSVLNALPSADAQPYGSTPMAAGLRQAFVALDAADSARPRVVLLVADGGVSGHCGEGESVEETEAQVETALNDNGVRTYVIGIGVNGTDALGLQAIAAAGGGAPQWFGPDDAATLDDNIEGIVAGLRSCEVKLTGTPQADLLRPRVGGGDALDEVPTCAGATDGYAYTQSEGSLELCGSACEAYLDGELLEVEAFCQPG